jgi:protein-tyrosine phosphatase
VIDTHCHLLPELDDGPRDLAEALELARELSAAGVSAVVCTPHLNRRFPVAEEAARAQLIRLKDALEHAGVELELTLSAEVGPNAAIETDGDELRRRAIAGRFLLVELEPATPASFVGLCTDRLDELSLVPVFAHPERCRAIQRDTSALADVRARGGLVQVVATSLAGSWGSSVGRAAWSFVASGRADLVASDSHRPGRQRLARVLAALAERAGAASAQRLTETAPQRIWNGEWAWS